MQKTRLHGVWLPLITPFRGGALDETSLRRLVQHYAAQPINGIILGATTGEGMALDDGEMERVSSIVGEVMRSVPVYLGLSGSNTRKTVSTLQQTARWRLDGYLISSPYYVRPSQEGIYQHFAALADSTARPIVIYNIPYRTGVSVSNATLRRLAALSNIVGLKDCSADAAQSAELLSDCPANFAIFAGEDHLFYTSLASGAVGGIVASAHVNPGAFASIYCRLAAGDQPGALTEWNRLVDLARLMFTEPSPGPIKHWLWRAALIDSPEMRLPMTPISQDLAARIDLLAVPDLHAS